MIETHELERRINLLEEKLWTSLKEWRG
jgi:hypothetical protein